MSNILSAHREDGSEVQISQQEYKSEAGKEWFNKELARNIQEESDSIRQQVIVAQDPDDLEGRLNGQFQLQLDREQEAYTFEKNLVVSLHEAGETVPSQFVESLQNHLIRIEEIKGKINGSVNK